MTVGPRRGWATRANLLDELNVFVRIESTGSYLIEWVFNIDGIGYLGFTSIVQRDYTVVMGVLAINTVLILFGNICSDILYALIDPRIRFE